MELVKITQDAIENFKKSNNRVFWQNDEELTEVFTQLFTTNPIESGADIYSLISGLLVDTSSFFKTVGVVDSRLWKPMMTKTENKIFPLLKENYEKEIEPYKKLYPAPIPEIMYIAEDYLQKLRDLCPIKKELSIEDEDAINSISTMASEFMNNLLNLFPSINNSVSDNLYMTSLQEMEMYKNFVSEAFDILIGLR